VRRETILYGKELRVTDPNDPCWNDQDDVPDKDPAEPFVSFDAACMEALSNVIKNLQQGLAPAWRVPIPVLPRIYFWPPLMSVAQFLKMDIGIHTKAIANLAPLIQAQHEQLARVFEIAQAGFRNTYPDNWQGVTGLQFELLEVILLDDGIPLMAVPRATTVQAILDAPDTTTRRAIVGQRWRSIATDCTYELNSFRQESIQQDLGFAQKAVTALSAGHKEAAQALAANLLDSLLRKHFTTDFTTTITSNKSNGSTLDLDDYTIRVACVVGPIWSAYKQFWTNRGDPVPSTFARHANVHAVSAAQYTRTNAVLAIMLVTSLLWFLEHRAA